jgi:hypothetical protein
MSIFLQSAVFQSYILPFLLVFTFVFAILEKTKLLGDDKHQINAIMGLVIGAIFITYGNWVGKMPQFVAFLVIALFVLFIFMLIYGFAFGKAELSEGYKQTIAAIAFVAVIVATIIIMGYWEKVYNFFSGSTGANVLFGIVIVAAIGAVLYKGGSEKKDKKD